MRDKDDLVLEWKEKHAGLRESKGELEERYRRLENYMNDLPTPDETQTKNNEISFWVHTKTFA